MNYKKAELTVKIICERYESKYNIQFGRNLE